MPTVAELYDRVRPDEWRTATPYSADILASHVQLHRAQSPAEVEEALGDWLARYQPCLFGRIAAKGNLIRYCVLTEEDLTGPDAALIDKLKRARQRWWNDAFYGRASGYVIAALSDRLACACPDADMLALASRLLGMHLLDEDAPPDRILMDSIYLEHQGGPKRRTWKWDVGINYFASHADGRWWHDHRFPGGIAFSLNSVGHMVKSGVINKALKELDEELHIEDGDWNDAHVDSLGKALILAMRTIEKAAAAVSGPATRLYVSGERDMEIRCPVDLPPALADKNPCEYLGWYHTDISLPLEYFRLDVTRPDDVQSHVLDFTYLFDRRPENPDFTRMGNGLVLRTCMAKMPKSGLREPSQVDVEDEPGLVAALGGA